MFLMSVELHSHHCAFFDMSFASKKRFFNFGILQNVVEHMKRLAGAFLVACHFPSSIEALSAWNKSQPLQHWSFFELSERNFGRCHTWIIVFLRKQANLIMNFWPGPAPVFKINWPYTKRTNALPGEGDHYSILYPVSYPCCRNWPSSVAARFRPRPITNWIKTKFYFPLEFLVELLTESESMGEEIDSNEFCCVW